ncbi:MULTISPECIES: GDSL-type esterase/lipase family protein [unclassified Lactococcus]|uniref:GDSL-type esterase/lipase family protein n=1 Tax=unclassified Lactococcus TaxID=2643510 RepID=UPI00210761D0|nr:MULTISPECIES: GDSL-type esterase/lipase family protein [unclassified Lactococcus]
MFGDSITNGYGYQSASASQILKEKCELLASQNGLALDVRLHGLNGDTSQRAMERLPLVLKEEADRVFIFFGANDSANYEPISPVSFYRYLEDMVEQIGPKKVVLITPPYHNDKFEPDLRNNKNLLRYGEQTKAVGQAQNVPVLDLHATMSALTDPNLCLQADGLHFSELGYEVLSELMVQFLIKEAKLKE